MTDDVLLRPGEARDLAAITAIYGEAVRNGTASYEVEPPNLEEMTRRWQALVEAGYPHLAAELAGKVVGYAYAGPFRERRAYRFMVEDSLYIAPEAQGRGIGRALLSELIAICERKGFRQMVAIIGGGNEHPASVALHSALGFRQVGVIGGSGFKLGRWLDTLIMQRGLGDGQATLPENGSESA